MITHIILNLPEEYQTKIEILEEKLDDKDIPLNIKRIHDELLENLTKWMNNQDQNLK